MGTGGRQITVAVELGDGRACWVVDWEDDGPRGWCIAAAALTQEEVGALVDDFVGQVGLPSARRALTAPYDLEGRAARIATVMAPPPLEPAAGGRRRHRR